jgi:indolepyruvate ferredoxin oxidoreductase beta subunit
MESFNVYLIGVGGQGIGLLSEVLLRAADYAGHRVNAVDTHGLAQRGGVVVSNLRLGPGVHSPIIPERGADLLVALERHEALRGINTALKDYGTLIYYNTVWQPLGVRLNRAAETREDTISRLCEKRSIREFKVFTPDLPDVRMQNVVVLGSINRHRLVPDITSEDYTKALKDLLQGETLQRNLKLFEEISHG